MIRPILFIDVDGVVADSISWWLTLHNFYYKTNYVRDDVTGWDTRECIGVDLSPYFGNYDMVEPIPRALESIGALWRYYRVVFATMGNGSKWLERYFIHPEIVVTQDKSLLRGFGLIDDRASNLDGFVGERFLLSQPWNRGRGLNDTSWDKITEYLLDKSKKKENTHER